MEENITYTAGFNCTPETCFDNYTTGSFNETVVGLCTSLLLICCLLALCVNSVVIISVYWIRSPMTPNLKISLSLAIADAISSSMTGLVLFLDSSDVPGNMGLVLCIIDLIRLSGIVITVLHLLALSLNHYIGIMKPLHYNSIVTRGKVSIAIACLWICPIILLSIVCTIENRRIIFEDIKNNTSSIEIFTTFSSRMSYSSLFFCPIVLMVFCYTHILITVKNQQKIWRNTPGTATTRNNGGHANRNGTTRSSGGQVNRNGTTRNSEGHISRRGIARNNEGHVHRNGTIRNNGGQVNRTNSQRATRERARLQGNIKAINTTLLILGSCFIGWMPALLIFILMCTNDCPIHGEALNTLNEKYPYEVMTLRLIENMLVIMKMLVNPIIYTIRMKEIKASTKEMYDAISGIFCSSRRNSNAYILAYQSSRNQNSVFTSHYRMNSLRNNPTESQII